MKYLINGCSGQLGHDLYKILNDGKNEVKAPSSVGLNLLDPVTIYETILTFRPDVIIHAAAYTAVDKAEEKVAECFNINARGTEWLTKAAWMVNAKLIYVSTDYVFDGEKGIPYYEDDKTSPINWYGICKNLGENYVLSYERGMVVRTQWVFGINGNNFVKTMLRLANSKDEIRVVDDQIGSPTYTVDLAKKLCLLSENFEYGIYHASNEGYMSWYDFAKMIFESTNVDISVIGIKTKDYKTAALRPLNTSLNKGKLESAVGCMSDAQDALERYVHELKNDDEMKLVLKENDKRWKR